MTAAAKKRTRGKTRRTVEVAEKVAVIEPVTGKYLGWAWLVKTEKGDSK